MKQLKNLIVLAGILLLSSNPVFSQKHFDQKLGEIQNDSYIITCNQDKLLHELEELVFANAHLQVRFDKLSIEQGEGYYYLLATDTDKHIKTARELVLIKGEFYENMSDEGGSITLTCSGCSVGCNPYKLNGNWVCYPDCTSGCTKTITIIIND
jgi:hypothetical protein